MSHGRYVTTLGCHRDLLLLTATQAKLGGPGASGDSPISAWHFTIGALRSKILVTVPVFVWVLMLAWHVIYPQSHLPSRSFILR